MCESFKPVVDDPEEVVEAPVAFSAKRGYDIICIHHAMNPKYLLFHSMNYKI
jgi:hypothetical protein